MWGFGYCGYSIIAEWQYEDNEYLGRVEGIADHLIVEAPTLAQFENCFHTAIDDYLELCADIGKEPDKPDENIIS